MKIFISITMAAVLIGLALIIVKGGNNVGTGQVADGKNVSVIDGKQIIDLTAKGGYSPMKTIAKAGLPTILRFTTSSTFDCSSFVRIPSMNINKSLSLSGATEIDLGKPKEGILHGSCGMGMYPFDIDFQT